MQGVAASLKGAAAMAHGQALAEATLPGSSVTLEDGTSIGMSGYYPAPTSSGIGASIDMSGIVSAVSGVTTWNFYPDAGRTSCVISYTKAANASAVPVISDTAVTGASAVSNCS
jgi:hypothetical protein